MHAWKGLDAVKWAANFIWEHLYKNRRGGIDEGSFKPIKQAQHGMTRRSLLDVGLIK